ncbi:uncharacterized protein LOC106476559 [Limulus polyphemus]|uniref:Uncharacterized protein LOC106476559 n=1 Tax=Limulus polyphemus TaxID=6850 RepID=A0ABM1C1M7_LIMPO|nr:uncharacterized protein LOC106476559 [Limulus polyphemus]
MRSQPRKILLGIFVCGFVGIFALFQWQSRYFEISNHPYFTYDLEQEEPFDEEQTCRIPRIHPFDNSIWRYLAESKPIRCKHRQGFLTYIDELGNLRFNETEREWIGTKRRKLSCFYQVVLRQNGSDDQITFGPKIILPPEGAPISHDFVHVSCVNFAGISVYSNIHAHIRNTSFLKKPKSKAYNVKKKVYYNVVIFGLDSLSRLSFIRLLPRTYNYLQGTMKGFVFRGMNKVGDNTFPNLVAMLTGKQAYGKELNSYDLYDDWPLIWSDFNKDGYVTLYAEDFPKFALFNYLSTGFQRPPTDHYFRPFWLALEGSSLYRFSSNMCFGAEPKHMLQIRYLKDFITKYRDVPHFAFSFLVEISHEYLSQVGAADEDMLRLLQDLYGGGLLNRTVFLFMSDHGHRFDAMRETLVGRIEERLPFFSMFLPETLKQEQPHVLHHLNENLKRLTTPYDVHASLVDILHYSVRQKPLGSVVLGKGRSLFGYIPLNRTCDDVGISEHYCTCEEEVPLAVSTAHVQTAAKSIVTQINNILSNFTDKCAILTLSRVKSAHLLSPNSKLVGYSIAGMAEKIRLVVETDPNKGLFEATLMNKEYSDAYEVVGDISRINKYGNQSECIQHAIIRKYCYCFR